MRTPISSNRFPIKTSLFGQCAVRLAPALLALLAFASAAAAGDSFNLFYPFSTTTMPDGLSVFVDHATNGAPGIKSNGYLSLTDNKWQKAALVISTLPGDQAITRLRTEFDLHMANTTDSPWPADGFSINFGKGITSRDADGENGSASGISITFDTYDNGSGDTAPAIELLYNGIRQGVAYFQNQYGTNAHSTNPFNMALSTASLSTSFSGTQAQYYTLTAAGGQGGRPSNGSHVGGNGAELSGHVLLSPTDRLIIGVGTMGGQGVSGNNNPSGGGGGGGTSIVLSNSAGNKLLMLAGGGGGGASGSDGVSATPDNTDGSSGSGSGGSGGSSGTGGNSGGGTNARGGAGGAGYTNDGQSSVDNNTPRAYGGQTYASGNNGGYTNCACQGTGGSGGWGGGGQGGPAGSSTDGGGGGGGGYSGGGGGHIGEGGGSGGSYVDPSVTSQSKATHSGDGYVKITYPDGITYDIIRASGSEFQTWSPPPPVTNVVQGTNFYHVVAEVGPAANGNGYVVNVWWGSTRVLTDVPLPADYAPLVNATMVISARTGFYYESHDFKNLQISGNTQVPVTVFSLFGQELPDFTPAVGTRWQASGSSVAFNAPPTLWLDQFKRVLPASQNSRAFYKAVCTGADVNGVPNQFTSFNIPSLQQPTVVKWQYALKILAEFHSGTESVANLSASDITDPSHQPRLGRHFLDDGYDGVDCVVYSSIGNAPSDPKSARLNCKGYVMENAPDSPERFLQLAGTGDYLLAANTALPSQLGAAASPGSFTLDYWARLAPSTNNANRAVIAIGSNSPNQLNVGYGPDGGLFAAVGTASVRLAGGWTDDSWHHWAVVNDAQANQVLFYRDATLVASNRPALPAYLGDGSVTIGARATGAASAADFFSGGLNNLRLWNAVRSRAQLADSLVTSTYGSSLSNQLILEVTFDTIPTLPLLNGVYVEQLDVTNLVSAVVGVSDSIMTNSVGPDFSLPSTDQWASAGRPTYWRLQSRWTGLPNEPEAAFTVTSDSDTRVFLDNQLVAAIATTNGQTTTTGPNIKITAGNHLLTVIKADASTNRTLSLKLAQYTPTYEIAGGSNLYVNARGLLNLATATGYSTEGGNYAFTFLGSGNLLPPWETGTNIIAAVLPGFQLGLAEPGTTTQVIASNGRAPLADWRRVFWGWNKQFYYKLSVSSTEQPGLDAGRYLPYFRTELTNVDGVNSVSSGSLGQGVVDVLELWLNEGEQLTVGSIYRTSDRKYTLSGISGQQSMFGVITLDKLADGFYTNSFAGGSAREYTFPAVSGPGYLTFQYSRTIHRAQLALGQGLDASSLGALNAQLTPRLPADAANPKITLSGPSATPDANNEAAPVGDGSPVWDYFSRKWYPSRPGVFNLTWPDQNGYTNTIEVHAQFPADSETRSASAAWQAQDGSRLGDATNNYTYAYPYPPVITNYPGTPYAHYTYALAPEGSYRADLDPSAIDNCKLLSLSYSENNTAQLHKSRSFTDTLVSNRSVLVFSTRPNLGQTATGDATKEFVTVRVLQALTRTNTGSAVVGQKLDPASDAAELGSGQVSDDSGNYNANIYDPAADVGQWGPIYPVNRNFNDKLQLTVGWYYNPRQVVASEPVAYIPSISTTYTNIDYPNPATADVIYISSQMGSEGVGQAVSTNGSPNYQTLLSPANFGSLAIYNQPDRSANGFNPNEEHALIAPSKAYQLTGDPQFNSGQSAAFALQNGINITNRGDANNYTSDPFVLVQYSVPGATNASSAYGMNFYVVKAEREGDSTFPATDPVTRTAFDESGLPVLQPSNPTYDFQHYTAFAGSPVVAPYPVNLAIGNVVLTDTIGGNLMTDAGNATRSLWQDKNGNRWVVAGGPDARFFQRYFYPLRTDFWMGEGGEAVAPGTPVAWAPPFATQGDITGFYGDNAIPMPAKYQAYWGSDYPVLKKGETLTYAGGEYKADHPSSPGLPAILNMASAELVFDSSNPSMVLTNDSEQITVREPRPGVRAKVWVNGYKVDGYIPSLDFIFEDGLKDPTKDKRDERDDTAEAGYSHSFESIPADANIRVVDHEDLDSAQKGVYYLNDLEFPTDWQSSDKRNGYSGGDNEEGKNVDYTRVSYAYWLRALLRIDTPGLYTFYLESGDGSRLYIDETKVVDADGYVPYVDYVDHEVVYLSDSGTIDLSAGDHQLDLQYFVQGPKNKGDNHETHPKLDVQWESVSAGIEKQPIPGSVLFVDPDDPVLEPVADSFKTTVDEEISFTRLSARVTRPLDRYAVSITQEAIPKDLQPANPDKVQVSGSRWYFKELPASLGKRFYYDSLVGELVFRGRLNDLESGAPDLTRQPVQPYVLEPNFLNDEDKEKLIKLTDEVAAEWTEAIEKLQEASSTEFTTGSDTGLGVVAVTDQTAMPFFRDTGGNSVALNPTPIGDGNFTKGVGSIVPASSFGIGSALVASPKTLGEDDDGPIYVTIAENNDPRATGAVALHVIQLSQERYRGSIQVLTPTDPFSEKINLKHTGDFGGNTAEIYYQWYVSKVGPLDQAGTPDGTNSKAWQPYQQGLGLNSIDFEGDPVTTLADKFFFVRYGGKEELMEADGTNDPEKGVVSEDSWRNVPPDDSDPDWSFASQDSVPFQWAGAANSPQLQADGSRNYIPQLVMGWVKRVLDQINLYEARYSATFNGDAPATYSSMLMEAGGPYIGAVALNSDKNNLENVGLIALYETVLQRAKDLTSTPGSADAGTDQAILLAATRLAFLYQLLGSEAFADAQNSVVPQSADSSAALSLDAFAFKNQVANPLQEELALLRGTDFLKAYPVFNRLFWNYFKADGEAFYNATYNISDPNNDGLINESDAAIQYPMGHGDAWGHYLSATEMHYELLKRPGYGWLAQPEYYALLGNVLPVDYLDEKTFATIAADKIRAGNEIVKATYRDAYVSDPEGQWQGYEDTTQPARAWGVSEWSRRVGQGAWFDWLAVNAVTPVPGPTTGNNALEGLDRIDRRTTVAETASVAAGLAELQQTVDNVNRGLNPLGLDGDAMAFDANPYYNGITWERMPPFKQSLDKAIAAAQNAVAAYEFASQADQQLRRIADDTDALKREALLQDLDYKNRLIAIYGRPYQGTIGPGKIFAEGYDGPDLLTYMYMDVIDPHALKPEVQGEFVWQQSLNDYVIGVGNGLDFQTIEFNPTTNGDGDTTGDFQNQWIFDNFYLTEGSEFGHLILDTPNHTGDAPGDGDTLISVHLPIFETSDFALQAPKDGSWGTRAAYGSIQDGLNAILVDQIALEVALEDYNDYLKKIQVQVFNARQKMDALKEDARFNTYYESFLIGFESAASVFETILDVQETTKVTAVRMANAATSTFPLNIVAVGGDVFSSVRGANNFAKATIETEIEWSQYLLKLGKTATELSAKITEIAKGTGEGTISRYNEFLEVLKELSLELLEEESKRGALMAPLQKMNYAKIKSQIAEGERLQLERAALNQQIAAKAQRNRYADLVTRLNRTEAMRKYDLALDNALRYAWLAVKTYDYETSLSDSHPASATRLLEEIVKTRTLGNWADGQPRVGNGGLAEILGELSADYDALQGQIGLNNGQGEANILSLRTEMMRISPSADSDGRWQNALSAARVSDLWQVTEFRQYCRPFAPSTNGPQPGLVIPFSTEIASGLNFFGQPLSGLDHAFSPANYATKIRSFTAAFQNYDVASSSDTNTSPQLSTSPRFYLVPAGLDMQYCSDTPQPTPRSWNVVSQRIPVPYVLNPQSLGNYNYQPTMDGRDGSYAERIRYGDSRAFISDYGFSGTNDMTLSPLTPGWNSSSRLYGRSVWNTRWLLIIPGATLNADKEAGLTRFIKTVTDIKLYLETYSNQGM